MSNIIHTIVEWFIHMESNGTFLLFKMSTLVLPPFLCVLYSSMAAIMVYVSGEYVHCPNILIIKNLITPIMFRSALLGILFGIAKKLQPPTPPNTDTTNSLTTSQQEQQEEQQFLGNLLLSIIVSIRFSYKLIRQTRIHIVEGGLSPWYKINEIMRISTSTSSSTTTTTETSSNSMMVVPSFFDSTESLVILITGANTGIGKETAEQLAVLGLRRDGGGGSMNVNVHTTIVLACRDVMKGNVTQNSIINRLKQETNQWDTKVTIDVIELDLCSYQSIRMAVTNITNKYPIVHVLINNAGVMMKDHIVTQDHNETTMQANHLGHFLLTTLLLPHIVPNTTSSSSTSTSTRRQQSVYYVPRIINITSSTYALTKKLPIDDLNCIKRPYTMFQQYSVSKLCNIFFASSLAKQYPTIYTASIHPGLVRTDVVRNMPWILRYPNYIFGSIIRTLQKTPAQGAWCTLEVVALIVDTSPITSGSYWLNRIRHPIQYQPQQQQHLENNNESYHSMEQDAIDLWRESVRLVQLSPTEIERIESIATNSLQSRSTTTNTTSTGTSPPKTKTNNKKITITKEQTTKGNTKKEK